jgi:hypothetical protein
MKRHIIQNLFALGLILLLTACASNVKYRGDDAICTYKVASDCYESALQVHALGKQDEYHLGFVEYDDQGQLRDPALTHNGVLRAFQRLAAADDVLLISFVHGWHHSAKPEDSNIASFREMLGNVSFMEYRAGQQQNRKKRKVIGLYVGWRGDSISVPYVNDLTFWERKNTAHEVGQQGVTEMLLKLEEIVNVKKANDKLVPQPSNSRLVVIGHSFGGAVVFSSLQKILTDRFIDSRADKNTQDTAKGFGDLVVLMNPAFEALRFGTLYDLSQQGCRRYFDTQLPKLAILTSEADYATKYAFSIGRFFSTMFESHVTLDRHYCDQPGSKGEQAMKIKEGQADRKTVGHFKPYLTHRLLPPDNIQVRSDDFQIRELQTIWAKHTNDVAVEFDGSRLESLNRTTSLNPYLNIRVDKKLINDHNDIWREEIVAFIRDLIVISTTPASPAQ